MQKKQFPTQEELIRQAMAAMGSEDYSTMHKCSKPKGFPFVVTFTQRLSLKNIYTQTDAGFIQPAQVVSTLPLAQIMATYDSLAEMRNKN